MKYSDLSALALKIAGLVLLVLVLSKMPEHFQSFKSFENAQAPTSIVYHLLPWAIVSFACIMLILFPYKISNKLIVQPEGATDKLSDSAIQIIGIRLLVFLLGFWAVSDLVYLFFIYFIFRDMAEASYGAGTYDFAALFATFAEIGFAWLLLFKAKFISGYINAVGK